MSEQAAPVVTIRVPTELLERLKARAAAEDRSLSNLLVNLARQAMTGWEVPR